MTPPFKVICPSGTPNVDELIGIDRPRRGHAWLDMPGVKQGKLARMASQVHQVLPAAVSSKAGGKPWGGS
jgi:hypothetical protein